MLPAPALRISTLLCVLLVTAVVASSLHQVVPFSAGDKVTLSCSDETKKPGNLSEVSLIVWRKENGSHPLHFVTDGKNDTSNNFTDSRFSFLRNQLPPLLQIRDARPEDAGNYTCTTTTVRLGNIERSWTLQISESPTFPFIYVYSSVAGAFVMLVLIITGIIYCKFCSKQNPIPSQIHQTCPENNQKEEPVYDNAHEDYFLRFNALYDRMPTYLMAQNPNNP